MAEPLRERMVVLPENYVLGKFAVLYQYIRLMGVDLSPDKR